MLDPATIDSLFPADLPEPAHWEQQFPQRELPDGAKVTRVGPSPTASPHMGTVYVAMIDKDISEQTKGVFLLRSEDTDQARLVEGAEEQLDRALAYFRADPDEREGQGSYGPYAQSARATIYHSYVRELLRQ